MHSCCVAPMIGLSTRPRGPSGHFGYLQDDEILEVGECAYPRNSLVVERYAVLLLDDVRDGEDSQRIESQIVQRRFVGDLIGFDAVVRAQVLDDVAFDFVFDRHDDFDVPLCSAGSRATANRVHVLQTHPDSSWRWRATARLVTLTFCADGTRLP